MEETRLNSEISLNYSKGFDQVAQLAEHWI